MTTPPTDATITFVNHVMGSIRDTHARDWKYGPLNKQHAMALVQEIERLRKKLAQVEKELTETRTAYERNTTTQS